MIDIEKLAINEMVSSTIAVASARGLARLNLLLLAKGLITEAEFDAARELMLRDFDITVTASDNPKVTAAVETARGLIERAWSRRERTTEEPTRPR